MSATEHPHPDPRAWEAWQTPPGVPSREHLNLLVTAAADQATAMLAGSTTDRPDPLTPPNTVDPPNTMGPPNTMDPLIDAVRLLASAAGAQHAPQAAALTGLPEDDLRRLVLAYRHGGTAGVASARTATPCGATDLAAAVDEVHSRRTFAIGELSVDTGTITDHGAGVRLRLGPDGRWYPATFARTQWWPAAGASTSAGAAYQAAVRAKSLRRANG